MSGCEDGVRYHAGLHRMLGTATGPHPLRSIQPQFAGIWRGESYTLYILQVHSHQQGKEIEF